MPIPNRLSDPGAFLDALGIQGVILSGGNDLAGAPQASTVAPERDRLEAQLIETCAQRDVPLLGVCRGLQHLVVHYGGRLSAIDRHVGHHHPITVRSGVLPLADRIEVNSYHDYGANETDLGPHLRAAAVAPDGSVEAVAHGSRRQWGIMWHPERAPRDPRDLDLMSALFHRAVA